MKTADDILAELRSKGTEKTQATYARHGMPTDKTLGASTADMKLAAKAIKGQQDAALQLYRSGFMEAMYVAGMVADGAKMSREQLNAWAEGADGLNMISEYTVPWVAVESTYGRELAIEWMKSAKEHVAVAGWRTYAGLVTVTPDEKLDLDEIVGLLQTIVAQIGSASNRVRYDMNSFVITVGTRVKPLLDQAKSAAEKIGVVLVDMGGTACKVRVATESLARAEASGKIGVKKKTIRC